MGDIRGGFFIQTLRKSRGPGPYRKGFKFEAKRINFYGWRENLKTAHKIFNQGRNPSFIFRKRYFFVSNIDYHSEDLRRVQELPPTHHYPLRPTLLHDFRSLMQDFPRLCNKEDQLLGTDRDYRTRCWSSCCPFWPSGKL